MFRLHQNMKRNFYQAWKSAWKLFCKLLSENGLFLWTWTFQSHFYEPSQFSRTFAVYSAKMTCSKVEWNPLCVLIWKGRNWLCIPLERCSNKNAKTIQERESLNQAFKRSQFCRIFSHFHYFRALKICVWHKNLFPLDSLHNFVHFNWIKAELTRHIFCVAWCNFIFFSKLVSLWERIEAKKKRFLMKKILQLRFPTLIKLTIKTPLKVSKFQFHTLKTEMDLILLLYS